MGKAWRIQFEGALYHILFRGNERIDIFYHDGDRSLFLDTVGEMSDKDRNRGYREKVQNYANEEKRLLKDLRHGIFLGTQEFMSKVRSKYLPDKPHKEVSQQRKIAREIDPALLLNRTAKYL